MCTMTSTTATLYILCVSYSFQTWLHVIIWMMFINTKRIKVSWLGVHVKVTLPAGERDAKHAKATIAPLLIQSKSELSFEVPFQSLFLYYAKVKRGGYLLM